MKFENFDFNSIYNEFEDINLISYLNKFGITDIEKFVSAKTIEDNEHYENIDKFRNVFEMFIKEKKIEKMYTLLDSDLDGYMSGSLIYLFMKEYAPNVEVIAIHHSEDNAKAHGLEDDEVMDFLRNNEPNLLWISDAGSSNVKECKELYELGYTIIISDHHNQTKVKVIDGVECNIDDYATVVNNQNGNVENKCGSGALVTWHCIDNIDTHIARTKKLVSYVMISLISDSMDMNTYENYTFSFRGKQKLHKNLIPIIAEFNYKNNQSNKDYSFGVISKCNATIRLGSIEDKENLFRLLVGEVTSDEFDSICSRMLSLHSEQSKLVKQFVENNKEDIENKSDSKGYILYKIKEKTPLTGLIGNKLLGSYGKTTFLLHEREDGEVAGSVRSNIDDLRSILNENGLFNYNEGHGNVFGTSYDISKEKEVIEYLDTFFASYKPHIRVIGTYAVNSIPSEIFELRVKLDALNACGKGLDIPQIHIKPFVVNGADFVKLTPSGTMLLLNSNDETFIFKFISKEKQKELNVGVDKKYKIEMLGEPTISEYNGANQITVNDYEVKEIGSSFDDVF